MSDWSSATAGPITFDHGHLFGCQGGCELPIHDCREAVNAALDALAKEIEGLRAFCVTIDSSSAGPLSTPVPARPLYDPSTLAAVLAKIEEARRG